MEIERKDDDLKIGVTMVFENAMRFFIIANLGK
jgi:hypothetical protein